MSIIVTDLERIPDIVASTDNKILLRLRIFAQFHGIAHSHKGSNGIYLRFGNIPGFAGTESRDRTYGFLIDESIYDEVFIRGRVGDKPHDGDILDLRCCYHAYGETVEIMHLKQITLKDLDSLREFVANSNNDELVHAFLRY